MTQEHGGVSLGWFGKSGGTEAFVNANALVMKLRGIKKRDVLIVSVREDVVDDNSCQSSKCK